LQGFAFASYGSRLSIAELPFVSQLNVRGSADAASEGLGIALPTTPNTVARAGAITALWLGPDEWLVLDRTLPVTAPAGTSFVDVSAQRTTIVLSGASTLQVLAHGCALDLERMGEQWCAQTELARASVILWGSRDRVHILVRASFARYLAAWLVDAAA
jgi:sarcosine oxidase subunit gamma